MLARRAVSTGANADVEVFDAPRRDGTQITILGVAKRFDATWDYARQASVPLVDRLRELLATNDLPGLTLVLDGEEVTPMFSRRGGARVPMTGSWGRGTTASVKAYRRPPGDRRGAYYVRLGGLLQFKVPAQRGNLKADVVVDLATTVRPGDAGYPLNAARDALQDSARWAFSDLVEQVERENESVGRNLDDEVFDPDSEDERERAGASELGELAAGAFADAAFQQALADAAGGVVDFYAERAKDTGVATPTASLAPPGTKRPPPEDEPERGPVLPPGFRVASTPVETDIAAPSSPVAELRRVFEATDRARASNLDGVLIVTADVRAALERAEAGTLDGRGIQTLAEAIDRAADASLDPGGGGLLQAANVAARANTAMDALIPGGTKGAARRNPFGRLAGLRISKKNYGRRRAARFKLGFERWMPHLTVWDATLRLIASEARIRRRFKPGFVLDDEVLGLTTSTSGGTSVVYIHPDRLEQVIKAHRERPLAIAAYLHGVACHELTHLDGRMGMGHSEAFVAGREDLGHATGHLLPAIAVLVANVLRLPVKPSAEQRRIERLERELERVRASAKSSRRTGRERLETELAATRAELAEAERRSAETRSGCGSSFECREGSARRVVSATVAALRAKPPAGLVAADVDAFAVRHGAKLEAIVATALAGLP